MLHTVALLVVLIKPNEIEGLSNATQKCHAIKFVLQTYYLGDQDTTWSFTLGTRSAGCFSRRLHTAENTLYTYTAHALHYIITGQDYIDAIHVIVLA